jgi:flagellar M-ring protein FliF
MAEAGQIVAVPQPAGGAGQQRAMAAVSRTKETILAMPSTRRNWLAAAVLLIAAAVAGMMWFAQRTDWRPLFNGLEGRDVQQVSQELAAAGIPFQTSADGTGVEVPAELVDKARMEVAAKGMPQSGRLGFELFDKPNWVGSEFDEKVNYQRALEGELEHTIGTLEVVRSARVHLSLTKESLFSAEEKVAKASVVLKLRRSTVTPEQADSIRNLVAGAVENLSAQDVTLVDADGRVNLNGHGGAAAEGDAEQAMEQKLVAMLEPLAGAGNVRAVVKATYDHASEERTDEVYDPASVVPISVQKSEQMSGNAAGRPSGVPGTASNTPAAAVKGAVQGSAQAAAPGTPPLLQSKDKEQLPVYPQAGGNQQTTKQESAGYVVSKHTTHSESGPGRLERVSAAVVVNDRESMEGSGKDAKTVWHPRTAEEMHRLEVLAQAAVGFDVKRGDQVVMQNVSFSANAPEMKPSGLDKVMEQAKAVLSSQPGMMRTAVTALIGLVLVWFVLKPVANQVVITLKEPALVATSQTTNQMAASAGLAGQAGAFGEGMRWDKGVEMPPGLKRPAAARDAVFEQVAEHIKSQPEQSTRMLETWIAADGDD